MLFDSPSFPSLHSPVPFASQDTGTSAPAGSGALARGVRPAALAPRCGAHRRGGRSRPRSGPDPAPEPLEERVPMLEVVSLAFFEIGRASCREREQISVGA